MINNFHYSAFSQALPGNGKSIAPFWEKSIDTADDSPTGGCPPTDLSWGRVSDPHEVGDS